MDIIRIVAFALIAAILALTVKKYSPEISLLLSITAGVIIFLMVVGKLEAVLAAINEAIQKSSIDMGYISLVLKIVGVAYIAEFGVQICNDAGENVLGSKIEFAGKVLILVMATPIFLNLLQLVFTML